MSVMAMLRQVVYAGARRIASHGWAPGRCCLHQVRIQQMIVAKKPM